MKAEKIIFGAACIGMGLILHSAYNKTTSESKSIKPTYFNDSVRLKSAINKDTICFSDAVRSDSLKVLKKLGK